MGAGVTHSRGGWPGVPVPGHRTGAGSSCVPEKGATANSFFRATNYPVGAVDPTNPERVVVTFGSYVNRHSNEENGCVPAGFSKDTGNPLYEGGKTVGACKTTSS